MTINKSSAIVEAIMKYGIFVFNCFVLIISIFLGGFYGVYVWIILQYNALWSTCI